MGKDNDLLDAARNGNVACIEKLLAGRPRRSSGGSLTSALASIINLKGVNINCTDANGFSPLHLAALNGHRDAVVTLLQNEASINAKENRGCTALHLAAWNDYHDICNSLLQPWPIPALVNIQNCDGETPLHCAALHGHSTTVSILLQNKADPTIRNLEEFSALDLASRYGRLEVVQQLATLFPSLLNQNIPTHSPLHLAARFGHRPIVICLLQLGFPINLKTENGTALHEAATFCKLDVIKCLLDHGINISETNKKGETAQAILKTLPAQKAREALELLAGEKPPHRPQRSASSSPMPIVRSQVYSQIPEQSCTDSWNSQDDVSPPPIPPRSIRRTQHPSKPVSTAPKVPVGTPPQGGLAFIGSAVTPKNEDSPIITQSEGPYPRKPPRRRAPDARQSQDSLVVSMDFDPREGPSKSDSASSSASISVDCSISEAAQESDASERDGLQTGQPDQVARRKSWSKQRAASVDISPKSPENKELAEKLAEVQAQRTEDARQADSCTKAQVFPSESNIPKETVITLTHSKEIEAKLASRPSSMTNGEVNHVRHRGARGEYSWESASSTWPKKKSSQGRAKDSKSRMEAGQGQMDTAVMGTSPVEEMEETFEKMEETTKSKKVPEDRAENPQEGAAEGPERVEKPKSLEFRQSVSSVGDIPLSPTGYIQPPTPDYPPPSPSTAALDIKQKINPQEKRRSKDMETLTDAALFPAVELENIPESAQGSINGELSPPDRESCGAGSTHDVRQQLENILDTSCTVLEPVPEEGTSREERHSPPQKEAAEEGSQVEAATSSDQTLAAQLSEPAVSRQASSGSDTADIERDLYAGLLRGSTPGGSRDVVSQLCDNVHADLRPVRHRPLTSLLSESLMEREELTRTSSTDQPQQQQQPQQLQQQQQQQQQQQSFSSGSSTSESSSSMPCSAVGDAVVMRDKKGSSGDEVFDLNEQWAQVAALLTSIGSGLVRESVFVRDFEADFTRTLTGTHKIQSVGDWLETLGLSQYENTLVANGFDDTDFLGGKIVEDEELQAIGITNEEHRKKILTAAESLPTLQPIGPGHMPSTVESWLESLQLEHYWDTFRSHQYDTMARVANLWELELTTVLDITSIGHKKRILASLGDRKPPDKNQTLPRRRVEEVVDEAAKSPFDNINLYKDYTGVRPVGASEDDRSSSSTGATEEAEESSERSIPVPDSMIYIRPPYVAHMAPIKQWRHRPDTLIKGCCKYTAQYLGSTLVRELKGPESTQEGIAKLKLPVDAYGYIKKSAEVIVKIPTIMLSISYKGVKFIDARSKRVICDHEIANIFCVCQDSEHLNFFAYITKDRETAKHFCHVFSARSREHAGEIILTLGEAFEIAYQLALKERSLEADDGEQPNSSDPDDQASLSSKNSITAV